MAEEKGVWRTISGRRVFIKEGQSLNDAMKASGKFKGKLSDAKKISKSSKKDKLADSAKAEKLKKEYGLNDQEIRRIEKGEHVLAKKGTMDSQGWKEKPAIYKDENGQYNESYKKEDIEKAEKQYSNGRTEKTSGEEKKKPSYYSDENKKDRDFVANSLQELRWNEERWEKLSKDYRSALPGGKNELKAKIRELEQAAKDNGFDNYIYKKGDFAKIKKEYLESYEDPDDFYYVVEDRGDRLVVSNFTKNQDRWNDSPLVGGIIPQNTWSKDMFEKQNVTLEDLNRKLKEDGGKNYSAYQRDPYTGRKKTVVKNGVAVAGYWFVNRQGNREYVPKGTRIDKNGDPIK